MTDSFFALPARLATKADHALTAADEQHFSAIAYRLASSISDLSDRRAALLHLPGGQGQSALERDLEIHRLTGRLRLTQRYGVDACLGRMVNDSGDVTYVGRLGLSADDGQSLLVDWRSPAAAPFFGATHANPMGLASRRRYRWTARQVTDYWDEVFTAEGLTSRAVLDDQSAFIASLSTSRSAHMRDVLGTIQADQDAIIRTRSRGALVIDGGPGTGKTVVALHRTAFLLYSDPNVTHRKGGVLFVGPHQPYLTYVSDVLPNLGEDGVQICTVRDLVNEGVTAVQESDPRVRALKESAELLQAITGAVAIYERPPVENITVHTPWADVQLSRDDWADVFDAAPRGVPHNEAREEVRQELVDLIVDRHDEDAPVERVRQSLARNEELRATLNRSWPILDPLALVGALWSKPGFLRRSAPWLGEGDIQLLQRSDARAWTVSDLPYLDAARQRIGDPLAGRRAREREEALAEQREQVERVVDELIAADDSELLLSTMLRGADAQNSLIDESALLSITPDELAGPFAHVVVDEAQELTDAEWGMLLARCPSQSFTIVGDRAQARHGFTDSWADRLHRVGLDDVSVAALTVNYRTPAEVMREAEPVIRAVLPDANVPTSIRRSGVPVVHASRADRDPIVDAWLAEHDDGIVCVIGDDTFIARPRVKSLSAVTAKGLEFDLVVLVEPETWGSGVQGGVDRYVAMTRATQQLVILSS
jgi:DNA helicase IV